MSRDTSGGDKIKKLLFIPYDVQGEFIERVNRFLGKVKVGDGVIYAHIHDPGRLKELLYEGNTVILKRAGGTKRKTKYDILAASTSDGWVFVHSGYHRAIAESIFKQKILKFGETVEIIPEIKYGDSRLDFLIKYDEKSMFVEVKGCTLLKNKIALFPDAPTKRGYRHLKELLNAVNNGYRAAVIFLIFNKTAKCFAPNSATDPFFSKMFTEAVKWGIEVYPILLSYDGKWIYYHGLIPICRKILL